MKKSERLARQARPGIEPGTSRRPALSAEPLRIWWGHIGKGFIIYVNCINRLFCFL